jgi:hypothetical protein
MVKIAKYEVKAMGKTNDQEQQLPDERIFFSISHSLINPEAHPTPAATLMTPAGQFLAHAPHSMQASRSTITACLSETLNT